MWQDHIYHPLALLPTQAGKSEITYILFSHFIYSECDFKKKSFNVYDVHCISRVQSIFLVVTTFPQPAYLSCTYWFPTFFIMTFQDNLLQTDVNILLSDVCKFYNASIPCICVPGGIKQMQLMFWFKEKSWIFQKMFIFAFLAKLKWENWYHSYPLNEQWAAG